MIKKTAGLLAIGFLAFLLLARLVSAANTVFLSDPSIGDAAHPNVKINFYPSGSISSSTYTGTAATAGAATTVNSPMLIGTAGITTHYQSSIYGDARTRSLYIQSYNDGGNANAVWQMFGGAIDNSYTIAAPKFKTWATYPGFAIGKSGDTPLRIVTYTSAGSDWAPVSPIEAIAVNSSGNVGIGTTNPSVKLDLGSTAAGTLRAYSETLSGLGGSGNVFIMADNNGGLFATSTVVGGGVGWAASSTDIYNTNAGKVGIGTENPLYTLDVSKNVADYVARIFNSNTIGTGNGLLIDTNSVSGSDNFPLNVKSNGTAILSVKENGRVGIGTTAPSAQLDVRGAAGIMVMGNNNNSILTGYGNSAGGGTLNHLMYVTGAGNGKYDIYNASGTSVVSLNSADVSYFNGGNVGIGTTNPSGLLELYDTAAANLSSKLTHVNTTGAPIYYFRMARTGLTAVASGDTLGAFYFDGHDGTAWRSALAGIETRVDGGVSTNDIPTRMYFSTTPDGSVTSAMRLAINNAGTIGMGGTLTNASTMAGANMVVLSTGNVGIGSTTPATKLAITGGTLGSQYNGGVVADPGIILDAATSSGTWIKSGINFSGNTQTSFIYNYSTAVNNSQLLIGTAGTERIRITSVGDVGIGKTNPSYVLDVNGAINGTSVLVNGVAVGGAGLWGLTSSKMYPVSTTYSIGIGTTNPGQKLDVLTGSSGDANGIYLAGSDSHNLRIAPSLGGGFYNQIVQSGDVAMIYSNGTPQGGGSLVIAPWSSTLSGIRMDSSGNVGIGTTNPTYKLDVTDLTVGSNFTISTTTIGTSTAARFSGGNGNALSLMPQLDINNYNPIVAAGDFGLILSKGGVRDNYTGFVIAPHSATKAGIRIASGTTPIIELEGNVGIGTSNPGYKLEVAGNVGATGYYSTSDARYKINVRPLSNVLTKIEKIEAVTFSWNRIKFPEKNFSANREIGFIAQNVEQEFPELVMTNADGYKTLMYDKFSSILLGAIKEQQAEIVNLENRINTLEKVLNKK